MKPATLILASATLLAVPLATRPAPADVVKLTNGGELHGVLVESEEGEGDSPSPTDVITVQTLTGGIVSVPAPDVEFITRRPKIVEEYEVLARSAADTVEGQWELAEWCRSNRLEEQQHEHLLRVVALERNHPQARQALGQKLHDGEWMTHAEIMEERGLVEHKGRWITPEERDLIEKTDAERSREQAWFATVRKLRNWLRSPNGEYYFQAQKELQAITDPDAVAALAKVFRDDPDPEVRNFYVSILDRIEGPKPVPALVTQSLYDVNRGVREAAFGAITETRREAALPYYLEGLRNKDNTVVRRAGRGLELVADERAIPELIKALITTHRYQVEVQESSPVISMARGGTFGSGGIPLPPEIDAAMRTGNLPFGVGINEPPRVVRTRVVTVTVNEENPEVLAALQKITGESFGFDERTWRLWWAAKKNGAG